MSNPSEIVDFLRARLIEDEAKAHAAGKVRGGSWAGKAIRGAGEYRGQVATTSWPVAFISSVTAAADEVDIAEHIARHDPAQVLREIDATRQIVERAAAEIETQDPPRATALFASGILMILVRSYADHPEFDEKWRP